MVNLRTKNSLFFFRLYSLVTPKLAWKAHFPHASYSELIKQSGFTMVTGVHTDVE